jgi:hypothetical protein
MLSRILIFLFVGTLQLPALDLKPWYGRNLEFEMKASYLYQHFQSIDHHYYPSDDSFLNLNLSLPYAQMSGTLEVVFADTHHRTFGLDCLRLMGRYQWLDDISGDPFTLTTSLTMTQAFRISLHDISSFHHGKFEGELNLSVGKEFSCEEIWTSRFWGVVGVGSADVGYPWIRAEVAFENNFSDEHQLRVLINTLWGLGHKKVPVGDFKGYGPVRHQSIDLGVRYSRFFECSGATASIEYAHRVYAKNFPSSADLVMFEWLYPFGI